MFQKLSLLYLWIICAAIILGSCKKDKISLAPTISSIYTPSEHGVGYYALAAKTNRIYVAVSDDVELKNIEVRLKTPAGFHSHVVHGGELISAFKAPNIGVWDATKSMSLSGTDSVVIFKFNAPADISGSWDLNVALLDSDGNITYREESVVVQNDSLPAILPVASIPAANSSGIVALKTGETFTFEGNIADVNYLQTVGATLYLGDNIAWHQEWTFDHEWIFELSDIVLPTFTQAGQYTLIINATDKNDWLNWLQADIIVSN